MGRASASTRLPHLTIDPTNVVTHWGLADLVNGTETITGCGTNVSQKFPLDWTADGPAGGPGYLPDTPLPASGLILSGTKLFKAPSSLTLTGTNLNWKFTWNVSPVKDDTCDDCKKNTAPALASDISSQNQSLGEDIPITGTPFTLHYQSDRQAGRAGAAAVAMVDARGIGGWTLNVHHVFDPLLQMFCINGSCTAYAVEPKALFLGSGGMRSDAEVQASVVLNGNVYLTSEDGSEVYLFQNGLHTQTLRPMTGALTYKFDYDSNARVIKVTDAVGNITIIQRALNGNPTAIVSPYGQITSLAVNTNGYLSQITNPAGQISKFTYSSRGLMTSYTDPKGNIYSFSYDGLGRLLKHADPAGGSISFARANNTSGYTVTETTALGRITKYQTAFSSTSSSTTQQFTNTWPNGLTATESKTRQSGHTSEATVFPDGTSYSESRGA